MSSIRTMSDWPQKIASFDELPVAFQTLTSPTSVEHWSYCIYVPENHRGHHVHPAYCIMLLEKHLLIAFQSEAELDVFKIPYKDILYVEKGIVFLRGWFTLAGLNSSQLKTHKFLFNAVKEELFDPIIERIRKENRNDRKVKLTKDRYNSFEFLAKENLKLYNYSYRIFRTEKPMLSIYQPEVSAKVLHLFKDIQIPNRVLHMTDKELILIQEPKKPMASSSKRGGVWRYIPLNKVDHIELDHHQGSEVTNMHICMVNKEQLTLKFAESKEIELYKITTELDYLKNAR